MSYRRHPSPDVHWYRYADREVRERERVAAIVGVIAFTIMGIVFFIGAITSVFSKPMTVMIIGQMVTGVLVAFMAWIQMSEVMIRTQDLRSDDKGIYAPKGLTRHQTLIPFEVIEHANRKQRRRFVTGKFLSTESYTVFPVRGVRSIIRSLVGFEYGFGFRPVIIVSQFHENSDLLLERIASIAG